MDSFTRRGSNIKKMDIRTPKTNTLFGPKVIDNLLAVNKANELCNRYSPDTIEFGGICAFAMEAYEAGRISKDDLDGIELKWGMGMTSRMESPVLKNLRGSRWSSVYECRLSVLNNSGRMGIGLKPHHLPGLRLLLDCELWNRPQQKIKKRKHACQYKIFCEC